MTICLAASVIEQILRDLQVNLRVLGVQVVVFCATFLLLSRILFGRVVDHLRRREEEVRQAHEAIERDRREAEERAKEYQAHLTRIDKEAYDRMQGIYREALAASGQIVTAAQAEARKQVEQARADIGREKREAAARVRADVARFTFEAVERVLETRLDPVRHGAIVEKFIEGRS
ncbi:MAG: ATP synthase F0 subunit B [Planctomycetes bacterium]|nr:ATP synthase F0 subunit B [Planctomycetota bacterium]